MSLADHADAVLALLYAEGRLTVYPAPDNGPRVAPTGAEPPFVTVHVSAERPLDGRLAMKSTRMHTRIYAHCTGGTDAAARRVADLVAGALLDAKPAVTGRVVYPIRFETHQPPREDESTGRLVSTLTDVYAWQTDPGTP